MNFLDIIILNILAICILSGFFEGIFKEIVSLTGIVAAFYPASKYYPLLINLLSNLVSNTAVMNIIGYFIIFSAVMIGVGMFGIIVHKAVWDIAFTKLTDHFIGTLAGFAKGVLLVSVIVVVLTAFLSKGSPLLRDSVFSPHVVVVSDKMALFVDKKMKKRFFTKRIALENSWEPRG